MPRISRIGGHGASPRSRVSLSVDGCWMAVAGAASKDCFGHAVAPVNGGAVVVGELRGTNSEYLFQEWDADGALLSSREGSLSALSLASGVAEEGTGCFAAAVPGLYRLDAGAVTWTKSYDYPFGSEAVTANGTYVWCSGGATTSIAQLNASDGSAVRLIDAWYGEVRALACDSSSNLYVLMGNYYGNLVGVAKFNSSGTLQWMRQLNATVNVAARTIAYGGGRLVIGGYRSTGSDYGFLASFDASTGDFEWGRTVSANYSFGLDLDANGFAYLHTFSDRPQVVKFNPDGGLVWSRQFTPSVGAFWNRSFYGVDHVRVDGDGLLVLGNTDDLKWPSGAGYACTFLARIPLHGGGTGTYELGVNSAGDPQTMTFEPAGLSASGWSVSVSTPSPSTSTSTLSAASYTDSGTSAGMSRDVVALA